MGAGPMGSAPAQPTFTTPQGRDAALWGMGEAVASSSPGPLDTGLVLTSAFTLTVFSQHRAGAGRGVCGGQDGAKEQRAELKGSRGSRVSSGGCSSLASHRCLHVQPLPSWVGESQALYWARFRCPLSRGLG